MDCLLFQQESVSCPGRPPPLQIFFTCVVVDAVLITSPDVSSHRTWLRSNGAAAAVEEEETDDEDRTLRQKIWLE